MISRNRTKQLAAQVLLITAVLVAGAALVVAARVTLEVSTGADTASALHEVATVPSYASQLVTWSPDAWIRQRRLEPSTRTLMEAAYIRAWAALGHYESTGDGAALHDTFSGLARRAALATPLSGLGGTWDLGHQLTLEFYALDGATVAFHDSGASIVRTAQTSGGETVVLSQETYDVVMVLEDGYWRVRQLRRGPNPMEVTVRYDAPGHTSVFTYQALPVRTVPALRATEYRPMSWAGLSAATVTGDLTRARALGLTAVRVPLSYTELGGANPSAAAIQAIKTLLTAATAARMSVILVPLDGLTDLSPGNWFAANHHLATLVTALRGSPSLALWDLADEPDLRTASATPTEIRAFLVQEAALVRITDPATPITISFSDAADAADPAMVALTDVVSLHSAAAPADLAAALNTVRTAARPRPVFLTVSGPTTDGGWSPIPGTEDRQSAFVADALRAAQQAGIDRVSVAALIDSTVGGKRGLLRADHSATPAALLVSPGAALDSAARPGLADYLGAKFWRALAVALVLTGIIFWQGRRRRHGPSTDEPAGRHRGRGSFGRWRNRLRDVVGRRSSRSKSDARSGPG